MTSFIRSSLDHLRAVADFLIPFSRPGTPLVQEVVHTLILCTLLYYGPQIVERLRLRRQPTQEPAEENGNQVSLPAEPGQPPENQEFPDPEDLPEDVLRDIDAEANAPDGEDAAIPPGAPDAPFPEFDAPGPAAGPARQRPANRAVGTKKARALERRDRQRAYNEFIRSQAEQQRAQDAAGAKEREEKLAAERERRAKVERELAEKREKGRRERKEREEKERTRDQLCKKAALALVREGVQSMGFVSLKDIAKNFEHVDAEWVKGLVKASGMADGVVRDGAVTMITRTGFVVKVDQDMMEETYKRALAENKLKTSLTDLGGILEQVVRGT